MWVVLEAGCKGSGFVFVFASLSTSVPALQPADVFEQPQPSGPKKIEFHISVPDVAAILEGLGQSQGAESAEEGEGRASTFPTFTLRVITLGAL